MENNTDKSTNVITKQSCSKTTKNESCTEVFKNHSNPIIKNLFKMAHTAINKNAEKYSAFSKFGPDDLR